jgi:hypothetical protein
MPIKFSCTCGRRLEIDDVYAGRRVRCPACKGVVLAPTVTAGPAAGAGAEEEYDVEWVEDECDVEILEDDEPTAVTPVAPLVPLAAGPPAPTAPAADPLLAASGGAPPPIKSDNKRPGSGDGSLSRMYEEQALAEQERQQALYRPRSREPGEGWTMFGVHITGGVLAGCGLLFGGLLAMGVIGLAFSLGYMPNPRLFIPAVGGTALGAIILVRALFFGEED